MNNTGFDGLRILEFHRFQDDRGVFSKILDQSFFSANQISADLKQVNYSVTNKQGTVRGLHYQRPPHSEYKIITCLHGEVFDVAVDLRKYSKTFLQYFTYHLKASIPKAIVIPSGFAHGFQALADFTTLLYFHDRSYEPEAEAGLNVSDVNLKIPWPLPILGLSDRDSNFPNINKKFEGLE